MKNRNKTNNKNSQLFGLLIVLFGLLLLVDGILPGIDFLDWIFSLPSILIIVGLLLTTRSNRNYTLSWIFIGLGLIFLIADLLSWDTGRIIWPLILIAAGLYIITGKRRKRHLDDPEPDGEEPIWDKRVYSEDSNESTGDAQEAFSASETSDKETSNHQESTRDDFVESTSIFGNTRNFIVSKQFRGGDIVNIMGGAEINLSQADLQGPAVLEVVQLFGGTTIVAPAHWVVIAEMSAIFGGVEDKRYVSAVPDKTKVLRIRGTSLFGGITIKSL